MTGDLVRVVFIQPGGKRQTASARVGESVMDCALDNAVDGIQAQCGGACTCCTCHVHVEPEWLPQLDEQHPDEAEMLEYAPGRAFNSRLSCQVVLSSDLDGLVVHICSES